MPRLEEMEGRRRETTSLSKTVEAVLSLVRRSRGEPEPTPEEAKEHIEDLMAEFAVELEQAEYAVAQDTKDRQERMDMRRMRAALHSGR